MLCLQAIKRMQQEPTEAELMLVRFLPFLHVVCFAVTSADAEIKATLAMQHCKELLSSMGYNNIVTSHRSLRSCTVRACILALAQEAVEILGNDTAGDEVKIGALQALHILLEPIDNANGQHLTITSLQDPTAAVHTGMCAGLESCESHVKA